MRSTDLGRRETSRSSGRKRAPSNSISLLWSNPSRRQASSRLAQSGSSAMKKSAFLQALVAEEERHQLRLLVVDVPHRELADRVREGEVEVLRERLAADDLAVLVGVRRQDQALLDHRRRREARRVVDALGARVVAVEHREALHRVELVVQGAGEDIATPGSMPKNTNAVRPARRNSSCRRQLLVDVRRADDVARAGGGHVEVVRAGLQAGGHDIEVHLWDEAVDDEVDAGERLDQRLRVVDVELQGLRLAGGELAGDHLRPGLVDIGEDDGSPPPARSPPCAPSPRPPSRHLAEVLA